MQHGDLMRAVPATMGQAMTEAEAQTAVKIHGQDRRDRGPASVIASSKLAWMLTALVQCACPKRRSVSSAEDACSPRRQPPGTHGTQKHTITAQHRSRESGLVIEPAVLSVG